MFGIFSAGVTKPPGHESGSGRVELSAGRL